MEFERWFKRWGAGVTVGSAIALPGQVRCHGERELLPAAPCPDPW